MMIFEKSHVSYTCKPEMGGGAGEAAEVSDLACERFGRLSDEPHTHVVCDKKKKKKKKKKEGVCWTELSSLLVSFHPCLLACSSYIST
jgi:hypothetical protein